MSNQTIWGYPVVEAGSEMLKHLQEAATGMPKPIRKIAVSSATLEAIKARWPSSQNARAAIGFGVAVVIEEGVPFGQHKVIE